jgi:hypothetical protein
MQLTQGGGLDLADALAGDALELADGVKRQLFAVESVTEAGHLEFAGRQLS